MPRSEFAAPRRRHRGRHLGVALLVLAALLVAADRIALVVAERAAADTIQRSEQLAAAPSVSVSGFPFLTQLAAGDFGQVTVRASGVQAGSGARRLRIAAVTLVLHQVRVGRNLSSVTAASGTATGTISYADLSRALGLSVGYAGSAGGIGRIRTSTSITVAGQRLTGSITAGLSVQASSLNFDRPAVDVTSGLASVATPLLRTAFGPPLPLGHLPFGVRVRAVLVGPAGITIELAGADLVYRRP